MTCCGCVMDQQIEFIWVKQWGVSLSSAIVAAYLSHVITIVTRIIPDNPPLTPAAPPPAPWSHLASHDLVTSDNRALMSRTARLLSEIPWTNRDTQSGLTLAGLNPVATRAGLCWTQIRGPSHITDQQYTGAPILCFQIWIILLLSSEEFEGFIFILLYRFWKQASNA